MVASQLLDNLRTNLAQLHGLNVQMFLLKFKERENINDLNIVAVFTAVGKLHFVRSIHLGV